MKLLWLPLALSVPPLKFTVPVPETRPTCPVTNRPLVPPFWMLLPPLNVAPSPRLIVPLPAPAEPKVVYGAAMRPDPLILRIPVLLA